MRVKGPEPRRPGVLGALRTPGSAGSAGSGAAGRRAAAGRKGKRGARFLRELVILVVIALVIAVVIKTYAIQAFFIPSGSMENTLEINDRVLVNKIVYDLRDIHRGDIVVFNGDGSWDPGTVPTSSNFVEEFYSGFASMFGFGRPGDILIKRVIGLPGDDVACCDAQGRVTVNGVPLNEQSYLYPGDVPSDIRFNIVVQPGRLWVMGDHRLISDDSRDHEGDPGGGTVPESAVLGRAFVIIWPPSRWRILPIPATFEQSKLSALAAGSPASAAAASASTAGLLSARLNHRARPCRYPSALPRLSPSAGCSAASGPGSPGAAPPAVRPALPPPSPGAYRPRRGLLRDPEASPRPALPWPRHRDNWRNLPSVMTRHSGVPTASLAPSAPLTSSAAMASSDSLAPARNPYPRYPGYTPRRDGGLAAYETVLGRAGFTPVAGIDEAGRGACAGPLVVAAVVLDPPASGGCPAWPTPSCCPRRPGRTRTPRYYAGPSTGTWS